jgi:hypothetical protein
MIEYAAANRDYNICLTAPNGVHDPRIAEVQDRELIDIGYVTLECRECGQTTGYPLDAIDPAKVDW